jgi:hypothetical protein
MAEGPQPFRVVYPETVREQLLQWSRQATDSAVRAALVAALNAIESRLSTDPLEWGETAYHLHHLGLAVCNGFHDRIHVRYAVDESRRIVYVRWFKLLPGHPLAPSS